MLFVHQNYAIVLTACRFQLEHQWTGTLKVQTGIRVPLFGLEGHNPPKIKIKTLEDCNTQCYTLLLARLFVNNKLKTRLTWIPIEESFLLGAVGGCSRVAPVFKVSFWD